jgi:hypothetical protein
MRKNDRLAKVVALQFSATLSTLSESGYFYRHKKVGRRIKSLGRSAGSVFRKLID